MPRKSLLLLHQDEPHWKSSQIIRKGLLALWRDSNLEIDTHLMNFNLPHWDENNTDKHYKRLIFCESNPHPWLLLSSKLPFSYDELVFHIYGNFTQLLPEWIKLLELAKDKLVSLIVASNAEKELLTNLLGKSSLRNILVIPYPLVIEKPKKNKKSVAKRRGERWIVYAGRMSLQKNVGSLLECLERFSNDHEELLGSTRFFFAGEFDSIFTPFAPPQKPGAMYQVFQKKLNGLPKPLREKIHLLGHLDQPDLLDLFSRSDLTISLSTFHDEDFGYAILQSLAEGCPVMLTQWGGYKDFIRGYPKFSYGIKVRLTEEGLALKYSDFERSLKKILKTKKSPEQRRACKKSVRKNFSSETLSKRVKTIKPQKLSLKKSHIAQDFIEKLNLLRTGKKKIFTSITSQDKLYDQVYRPYFFSED